MTGNSSADIAAPPRFVVPVGWVARLEPFMRLPGAYLFGGALRDYALGRPAKDMDMLLPRPVAAAVRQAAGAATVVELDAAREIFRVVWRDGAVLDIKGYAEIDGEIHRSDFTINALLVNCATGEWEDRVGGIADLAARRLRAVAGTAFTDDPVRILRATRFAAQLELVLLPETAALLRAALPQLAQVAGERLVDELRAMANDRSAPAAWLGLEQTGALTALFPFLAAARGCRQNGYHHLDVLAHSLEAARCWADGVLAQLGDERWQAYLAEPLGLWTRQGVIMLYLLLHDAGKPQTRSVDADGRCHFYDHEVRGAELLAEKLAELGLPHEVTGAIVLLTRHHMRAGLAFHREAGLRVRRRYADLAGDWAPAGWAAALADRLATRGPDSEGDPGRLLAELRALGEQWFARRGELLLPKLVNGNDILALAPGLAGPRIGELLRRARAAQIDGELRDRAAALAAVQGWLQEK